MTNEKKFKNIIRCLCYPDFIFIEPRLGDLEYASGTVVTELGAVPVVWRREDKVIKFEFEIPQRVIAIVDIPYIKKVESMIVNDADWLKEVKGKRPAFLVNGDGLQFTDDAGKYKGVIIAQ